MYAYTQYMYCMCKIINLIAPSYIGDRQRINVNFLQSSEINAYPPIADVGPVQVRHQHSVDETEGKAKKRVTLR